MAHSVYEMLHLFGRGVCLGNTAFDLAKSFLELLVFAECFRELLIEWVRTVVHCGYV